ncbi:hypothetical protein DPMN_174781 [Dreissena polymorpha]|uniref:HTH CENPB-type domain-containing protein n=1 Tax=Dreissena polymorpha TaxID=45954 RepID=A0A9D4IGN8_DREPO|nr:hypothetical protein DPMN_174781 [Dreissena polymorpha]
MCRLTVIMGQTHYLQKMKMSDIGHGYSLMDIQYMAWDYAMSLHKPVKAKEHLSQGWMYSFLSRWEELKVVKHPRKTLTSTSKS